MKMDVQLTAHSLAQVLVSTLQNSAVKDIILFGSRARMEPRLDSDYDIYVVLSKELNRDQRRALKGHLLSIFKELNVALDLLMSHEEAFMARANYAGTLQHTVKTEGISLKNHL